MHSPIIGILHFLAQLKEAKLRSDFYDEMINVAEKIFNISIREK
jgi:hypothetical protein